MKNVFFTLSNSGIYLFTLQHLSTAEINTALSIVLQIVVALTALVRTASELKQLYKKRKTKKTDVREEK